MFWYRRRQHRQGLRHRGVRRPSVAVRQQQVDDGRFLTRKAAEHRVRDDGIAAEAFQQCRRGRVA